MKREKRCCQFCMDTDQNGLQFNARSFTFGICRECAEKLIMEFKETWTTLNTKRNKNEHI